MPQFASFDPTVAAPSPVTGWYDTDVFTYASLPGSLIAMTPEQWAARLSGTWAVAADALVAYTPEPPTLTIAEQAAVAIMGGLSVSSSGTPALNGTYAVDAGAQAHMQAEVMSILLNGTFVDGASTVAWPDMSGETHSFSVTAFKAFATTAMTFVVALYKCSNGTSKTLPAPSVDIP